MKGDKIFVGEEHRRAAETIVNILLPSLRQHDGKVAISIGGESGSGKSELAVATADALTKRKIASVIIQQDDYFVYPPRTNDARRRREIHRVGPSEVRLDLLDEHIRAIIDGAESIDKPLVVYEDNEITRERLLLNGVNVVIVEGTYTTLLANVHARIFIDRTYEQTRDTRLRRNREAPDPFLEQVLKIEHAIIADHRKCADIIVTDCFAVVTQTSMGEPCRSPIRNRDLSEEVITEGKLHRVKL